MPVASTFSDDEQQIRDAYARREPSDRYSWFAPAQLYLFQERERRTLGCLRRLGLTSLRETSVLEVGCGTAAWLHDFLKWGAEPERLAGIDLLPERVERARAHSPASMDLRCGSGTALPYADGAFDLVLQSVVFSSVLDAGHRRGIAAEMARVLAPGGAILWYDFHVDNPRNRDVRGVRPRELRALFPGWRVELERLTLAPPIARRVAPWSPMLCQLLGRVPVLCTHHLAVIRRRG